jgi:DNA-binding CsgD family transcriptional regulator/PAS domain-containing protein
MAEPDQIEAVIRAIYDAALAPEAWPQVLADAARVLAAGIGTLTRRAIATGNGVPLGGGIDPPGADEFFGYYAPRSPLFRRVAGLTPGIIVTDRDLLPKAEFQRSEIYNEYFLKHEVNALIAMPLWRDGGEIVCVHFARAPRAPEFEIGDKTLLGRLAPHLQRAFTLSRRLGLLQAKSECGLELFERMRQAVLIVDGEARVLYANGAAETLLRLGDGLGVGPGGLRGSLPIGTRRLREAIARAAGGADGGAIVLERFAAAPLYALATPIRDGDRWFAAGGPRVLLTISDPERRATPAARTLSELFGLTPAEANVALLLHQGRDLNAVASALGVTRNTARTHLQQVLAKTGCHRQTELVLRLSAIAQLGPEGEGR